MSTDDDERVASLLVDAVSMTRDQLVRLRNVARIYPDPRARNDEQAELYARLRRLLSDFEWQVMTGDADPSWLEQMGMARAVVDREGDAAQQRGEIGDAASAARWLQRRAWLRRA